MSFVFYMLLPCLKTTRRWSELWWTPAECQPIHYHDDVMALLGVWM